MAVQVTLEQAYTEACQALGEALVQQRILSAELVKVQQVQPVTEQEPVQDQRE